MQGHVYNSSNGEAEARRLPQIQDQPGFTVSSRLTWTTKNNNKNKTLKKINTKHFQVNNKNITNMKKK